MLTKNKEGLILDWKFESSYARIQMLPCSYLEKETKSTETFDRYKKVLESKNEQFTNQ